jgi:hypothetical protein
MNPPLHTLTFNRQTGGPELVDAWIGALNRPDLVQSKSGYLFKAVLRDPHWMLEAVPCLINGERAYHHTLLPGTDAETALIGTVNAQGVFTLLIRPGKSPAPTRPPPAAALHLLQRFARLLLTRGYCGTGMLDEVTQGLLKSLAPEPVPRTLNELAAGAAD